MNEEIDLHFALAGREHLSSIVSLLVDDELGSRREVASDKLDRCYIDAFEAIDADPNNELVIAEYEGSVVGTLQVTYTPNLTHQGTMRATIEGVRVSSTFRSLSIGTRLLNWTIDRCRVRGCRLIQLTSDLARVDAIEFYGRVGFKPTHAGLKLWL